MSSASIFQDDSDYPPVPKLEHALWVSSEGSPEAYESGYALSLATGLVRRKSTSPSIPWWMFSLPSALLGALIFWESATWWMSQPRELDPVAWKLGPSSLSMRQWLYRAEIGEAVATATDFTVPVCPVLPRSPQESRSSLNERDYAYSSGAATGCGEIVGLAMANDFDVNEEVLLNMTQEYGEGQVVSRVGSTVLNALMVWNILSGIVAFESMDPDKTNITATDLDAHGIAKVSLEDAVRNHNGSLSSLKLAFQQVAKQTPEYFYFPLKREHTSDSASMNISDTAVLYCKSFETALTNLGYSAAENSAQMLSIAEADVAPTAIDETEQAGMRSILSQLLQHEGREAEASDLEVEVSRYTSKVWRSMQFVAEAVFHGDIGDRPAKVNAQPDCTYILHYWDSKHSSHTMFGFIVDTGKNVFLPVRMRMHAIPSHTRNALERASKMLVRQPLRELFDNTVGQWICLG